ncbi:MAG: 6,7-dimethyl-8-ribityllumazine synthase [Pseudomonadota bacterium]
MPQILIIDAPYYEHISKELVAGAEAVLRKAGASWDYQAVPGVLEIPTALSMVVAASFDGFEEDGMPPVPGMGSSGMQYDGFITLGCVIRGETSHYEIVAFESARAITSLCVDHCLCLGNGIQTVENEAQALARAKASDLDKGGHAAQAALDMIALREKFLG